MEIIYLSLVHTGSWGTFFVKYPVLGVYTHSMETFYLSLRAQVAVGVFFMKSPVEDTIGLIQF